MTVSRSDVLRMLAEMARLTALDEGSPQSFKARAYEAAVAGVEGHPGELSGLSKADLVKIKGVGNAIADKIIELDTTGRVAKLEDMRAKYPPGFVELTRIPGLGPKKLKLLRDHLGVVDLDSLIAALDAEQIRELPGMGAASEEKIRRSIERLGMGGKDRRTPIMDVWGFAHALAKRFAEIPGVTASMPCGSLRRFSDTVGDIDIVVATTDPVTVMRIVTELPQLSELVGAGDTKTSFLTHEGLQVDVRAVRPDQFGSALLYFTGSKVHNIALRQRAIDRGLLLNEYGLFENDQVVASDTEEDIYAALGMEFVPPPLREGRGEVEVAAGDGLPRLVQRSDIAGDMHFHSSRSGDGRSSLAEMVEAAIAAGYRYVAFTDHGEDLTINGSTREEMLDHRNRIRKLDDRYPEIDLLFGCELNISPDGDLDYDAAFRLEFDWCVASIHSHFDLPAEQQTVRILKALADPAVNAIGHLTGRYVGRRPGVELDVDAVLQGLATTGVVLEINGALDRLDATDEVARRAMAAGVDVVINTDSHHVRELVRMDYGVTWAQRGWVTVDRVLNAQPVEVIRSRVSARR